MLRKSLAKDLKRFQLYSRACFLRSGAIYTWVILWCQIIVQAKQLAWKGLGESTGTEVDTERPEGSLWVFKCKVQGQQSTAGVCVNSRWICIIADGNLRFLCQTGGWALSFLGMRPLTPHGQGKGYEPLLPQWDQIGIIPRRLKLWELQPLKSPQTPITFMLLDAFKIHLPFKSITLILFLNLWRLFNTIYVNLEKIKN